MTTFNNVNTTAIDPPLKWHGGKHYLAKKIIGLMPHHVHYVEPYFGGGAVLLAKDPEGVSEVANDLNNGLMNFWSVLANPSAFASFARILQAVPFSESAWNEHSEKSQQIGGLEIAQENEIAAVNRAVSFFIACRQSMSGRMTGFAPLSRTRTRRNMNEQASAWINAVDGLPAVHARLRRVVVLSQPAVDVIRKQDGPDTLFYLDPPYPHETRASTGEYEHEMTAQDHAELLTVITKIEGKFLLSGYDSELYRQFERKYGWTRHTFELPNNAAGGDTKRRMLEIVWTNFSSAFRQE